MGAHSASNAPKEGPTKDRTTLFLHTLLFMPAQIIGPLAQFAAILVFTHRLAPGPYGVLTYVMASQDFVFVLCLSWWSQYTVRYFCGEDAEAEARYRDSEFAILLATVLPQISAAVSTLFLISVKLSVGLVGVTILYTVSRCFNLHLAERARAQRRILDYTLASAAGPVLGLVLALLLVMLASATPEAALLGYCGAQISMLALLLTRQNISFALRRPDYGLLEQALRFGMPLIAAGVAAWFGMNIIRVLVDHERGAAAMGLIAVGWSLGQRITTTAAMVVTIAAFPLAVERFRLGQREAAYRQITANGLLMLAIVLPCAVGLYLVREPLVTLLVAQPFRATTEAVLPPALAAGLFRNIRTHIADQVFVLIERTPMVCAMTIVESLAVAAGCFLGLSIDGPVGAAYGCAAGYGATMIVNFVVARLRAGLRLPFAETGYVVLATCAMVAVVDVLPLGMTPAGGAIGRITVIAAIGALTYGLVILTFFPVITRNALRLLERDPTG